MRRSTTIASLAVLLAAVPGAAQDAVPAPSYGYDFPWKVTLGLYRTAGESSLDVNLRRTLGDFHAWVGAYVDPHGQAVRVGVDYTYDSEWLRFSPTVAAATNGFLGGQVYAEAGRDVFLIAGYSQTNLKDYFNLTFDPNESVQLGAGWKIDERSRLNVFTIFDVRLGTGQQDTHLIYRHHFDHAHRVTADLLYKSGRTDEGEFVRGLGVTVTYDWPRLFVRAAYDPYVNFTDDTMVRIGGGWRF